MTAVAPAMSRLRELANSLDAAEHELVSFFEFAPELMAVVDEDGLFLHFNRAWNRLLGWDSVDEISWFELFYRDDEQRIRELVIDLECDEVVHFNSRVLRSDHKFIVAEFSLVKRYDNRFNLTGRPVSDRCADCVFSAQKLQRRLRCATINNS